MAARTPRTGRTTKAVATRAPRSTASDKKHVDIDLVEFSRKAMYEYGAYTIENRAIPEFRDGLKPVHRLTIWAAYKLGLSPDSKYVKCARVVGNVIGQYHPHGDASAYDALVNIAGTLRDKSSRSKLKDNGDVWTQRNAMVPLIEGFGNFGDFLDGAAAQRYTECRLSVFARQLMLDPASLAVTPMMRNFSDDLDMPMYLPAKLPLSLLLGSESLAVAVRGGSPAFTFDSVLDLVRKALTTRARKAGTKFEVKPQHCLSLKPVGTYGGYCVSNDETLLEFFETGTASLEFQPSYTVNKRTITITSVCPGIESANALTKLMEELARIKGVKTVAESTGSGKFKIVVECAPRMSEAEFSVLMTAFVKTIRTRKFYSVVSTERHDSERVEFSNTTVPQLLNRWLDWRVGHELAVLDYHISEFQRKLHIVNLKILAVDHLQIIFDSLKVEDSAAYLVKKLKITLDDANFILDRQVRQLKKLEMSKLKAERAELLKSIKETTAMKKTPEQSVLNDLAEVTKIVTPYIPVTDLSGAPSSAPPRRTRAPRA